MNWNFWSLCIHNSRNSLLSCLEQLCIFQSLPKLKVQGMCYLPKFQRYNVFYLQDRICFTYESTSVHWGITPALHLPPLPPIQKHHLFSLAKSPLKSANCPKSWILQWKPKILKFFILNSILSFKINQILSLNFPVWPVWILSYDREK